MLCRIFPCFRIGFVALLLATAITSVRAATFIVNNVNDSGTGSFRQAIVQANNTPGADTITFQIPGAGVQTISLTTPLPTITDPLTIDGYTQAGSSQNTLTTGINAVLRIVLNGVNAGTASGLTLQANNCVIRGLVITRFSFYGIDIRSRNNVIEGNFIGTDVTGVRSLGNSSYGVAVFNGADNVIGGTAPAARNLISGNSDSGVKLFNATGNRVQGNFIGTDITGTAAVANLGPGVDISGGGTNLVGGLSTIAGNLISGNAGAGVDINNGSEQISFSNAVQGNYIGVDRNGAAALPNGGGGVAIQTAFLNIIGGTASGARNLISGNSFAGVFIGNAVGNVVQGNYIGTDVTGQNAIGNPVGIDLFSSTANTTIGGPNAGAGNLISFNGIGVRVLPSAGTGNFISANSISKNNNPQVPGLGIDLGGDGPTNNDPGDADKGPNDFQNFPVLTDATTLGTSITIKGNFNGRPAANFRFEFFANAQCDLGGFGEGAIFLGAQNITTDTTGNFTFSVTFSASVPAGSVITATATDGANNTSEFSQCVLVRNLPPSITTQPASQTVTNGGNATFNVAATGTPPLGYQWRFKGSDLTGQTGTSLTILNASPANEGNYTVVVSNVAGMETSAVATLTVLVPPAINAQPASQTVTNGDNATFSVGATGTAPLRYQWRFKGSNLLGQNNSALTIFSAAPVNEGDYTVIVSNAAGVVTSAVATLTVLVPPGITTQPANQTVISGNDATFIVGANGTPPLAYQWRFNGSNLAGQNGPSLTISAAKPINEGNYRVVISNIAGIVTSAVATLTVLVPPAITTQPLSQTVAGGGTATFSVMATGTAPLSYQWRFNGSNLSGQTAQSLTIGNAGTNDQGNYTVVVSNSAGSVTSVVATLTVNVFTPPVITSQPSSVTINNGGTATFSVTATGSAPLSYQWRFNGQNLSGRVNPSLTIAGAAAGSAGNYTVVVSNPAGSVTSVVATLTVVAPPPDLKLQVSVSPGTPMLGDTITYSLAVIADSGPSGSSINNVFVTNELSANVKFIGATPSRGTCTVSNNIVVCDLGNFAPGAAPATIAIDVFPLAAGNMVNRAVAVSSTPDADVFNNAVLTQFFVFQFGAPVIIQQPQDQTVPPGTDVSLQVVAGPQPLTYQWKRNGINLPAQTNSTLLLPNIGPLDGGGYSVAVRNDFDAVNSRLAVVKVQGAVLPFADDFANAGLITQASGRGVGDNNGATRQLNEPVHAGKPGLRSVWINWLAPQDGIVAFSTDGSTFDTVLAAYTGQSLGTLIEVDSDDDSGSFLNSRIIFKATAGTVYHIAVDGFARVQGCIVLSWQFESTLDARPFILNHPASQVVRLGDAVQFRVDVAPNPTGEPYQYQWFFDGNAIPQANEATLIIPSATTDNLGRYFVRVTLRNRFTDSRVAFLQIIQGLNVTDAGLAGEKFADVVADALRSLPVALKSERTKAVAKGFTGTQIFSTLGSSTEPGEPNHCGVVGGASYWFAYQAPTNGVVLMTTDGSSFNTVLAIYTGPGDDFSTLVPVACDNNSGADGLDSKTAFPCTASTIYWIAVDGVGGVSGNVNLGWTLFQRPQITAQPAPRTITNGNTATFNVTATGAGGLGIQWRFNGANMPNQTNTALTLIGATPANEGSYTVVITNFAGSVTSAVANLTVLVPPTIAAQPINETVAISGNASFSVMANGSAPLNYQWRFNGANLVGQTSSSLAINSAGPANGGSYTVVVSNGAGSITSIVVTLTVNALPSITGQPVSRIVTNGSSVTFNVTAGTPPLTYQWRFNASDIPGASNASLLLNNVQPANSGNYTVRVSNSSGAVTSAVASLTVLLPLELRDATQTVSGVRFTVVGSANVNFTVQGSTDLLIWLPILTTNSPTGSFDFTDPSAGSFSNRFYRALHDL